MKTRAIKFVAFFLGLIIVMTVARILFVLIEPVYKMADLIHLPAIVYHGLAMDLSMSAYLTVIPGMILIASIWTENRWLRKVSVGYLWLVAFLIGFTTVLDAALFPFWNFRLDTTPFFYFFTSPGSAMASMPLWAEGLLLLLAIGVVVGLYYAFRWLWLPLPDDKPTRPWLATGLMTVLTTLLIIPIRGGITVSTMTTGRGFFSTDMRLNHATINPLFSLMYSLTHSDNFADSFRFFEVTEAEAKMTELYSGRWDGETPDVRLSTASPDVYLIILESFSNGLMPSLGGEPVAANLDRLATEEGILFTDFYAESFRTDRALPVILSGYPAMPTASVMRYTNKLGNMPGLARTLKNNGWRTRYYYGGDADFTNMKAYLVASGFDKIVSDTDFPVGERLSKWGVHDGPLFKRVLNETDRDGHPVFTVVQTSSSHEPFDVPYSRLDDKKKNAFAYTDNCVAEFIDGLKSSGAWNNALVIIVPDHWGAWPPDLKDFKARHHVPLILTGGALEGAPARFNRPSSQSDIAPTVLGLIGLSDKDFVFGKNVFDSATPAFAWITEPDWFGMITPRATVVLTADGAVLESDGNEDDSDRAKAFIQQVYTDFSSR